MRRALRVSAAAAAAVGVLALASPAFATVRHVHPGQSIQAAINASHPGDTIKVAAGVYHQNLTIATNHITLWGAGSGRHGTVLKPRKHPLPSPCTNSNGTAKFVNGICSVGQFDPATGDPGAPIDGTTIHGFRVVGFSSTGIIFFNDAHTVVSGNRAIGNADYGIAAFVNNHITYTHNVATGSEEAGFYIGDSPDAEAVVTHNVAKGNLFGFFFRDSQHGLFAHDFTKGNCVGIMTLDTGGARRRGLRRDRAEPDLPQPEGLPGRRGPAPVRRRHLALRDDSRQRVGKPGDEEPAVRPELHNRRHRRSLGRHRRRGRPDLNVVTQNFVHDNLSKDLKYDGTGSGNTFPNNDCGTSHPGGLC